MIRIISSDEMIIAESPHVNNVLEDETVYVVDVWGSIILIHIALGTDLTESTHNKVAPTPMGSAAIGAFFSRKYGSSVFPKHVIISSALSQRELSCVGSLISPKWSYRVI